MIRRKKGILVCPVHQEADPILDGLETLELLYEVLATIKASAISEVKRDVNS